MQTPRTVGHGGIMGLFHWAAPIFGRFADRWSARDIDEIAGWLAPFIGPTKRILDVGGGTGALAVKLAAALECDVTVLDPSPHMLRYVPEKGPVRAVLGTAEHMPLANNEFDALISTDAFHHFRDQDGAVREMARVVRCGGAVIIVELDPKPLLMRPIVAGEKLLGEPGTFFRREELREFFAQHGINGECIKMSAASYRFVGIVERGVQPPTRLSPEPSGRLAVPNDSATA